MAVSIGPFQMIKEVGWSSWEILSIAGFSDNEAAFIVEEGGSRIKVFVEASDECGGPNTTGQSLLVRRNFFTQNGGSLTITPVGSVVDEGSASSGGAFSIDLATDGAPGSSKNIMQQGEINFGGPACVLQSPPYITLQDNPIPLVAGNNYIEVSVGHSSDVFGGAGLKHDISFQVSLNP